MRSSMLLIQKTLLLNKRVLSSKSEFHLNVSKTFSLVPKSKWLEGKRMWNGKTPCHLLTPVLKSTVCFKMPALYRMCIPEWKEIWFPRTGYFLKKRVSQEKVGWESGLCLISSRGFRIRTTTRLSRSGSDPWVQNASLEPVVFPSSSMSGRPAMAEGDTHTAKAASKIKKPSSWRLLQENCIDH